MDTSTLIESFAEFAKFKSIDRPTMMKIVEDVFLRSDLVKFAKTFPDEQTMSKDFEDMKAFVKRSSKDLEAEQLRTGV